jgi:hypothetical protein
MELTPTESGWLMRSEYKKEEIALTHFLKVHAHFSVPITSTDQSDEVERNEQIVPQL